VLSDEDTDQNLRIVSKGKMKNKEKEKRGGSEDDYFL
jgi:hypothetical protein